MEILDWEEIELPAGRMPGVGQMTHYLRLFRTGAPGGWLVLAMSGSMGLCPSLIHWPDAGAAGTRTEVGEWEELERPPGRRAGPRVFRASAAGGWLVMAVSESMGVVEATAFVADAGHTWQPPEPVWEEIELPAGRLPGVGPHVRYFKLFRTPVPEGWLLLGRVENSAAPPALAVVPDPEHEWTAGTATELLAADPPAGRGTELESSSGP